MHRVLICFSIYHSKSDLSYSVLQSDRVERQLFDEILALVECPEGLSLGRASTLLLQKSYARVTHGLRIVDDEGSDVDRSKAELANNSDAKVVMEQWKESVASATTMEEMVTLSDLMFQLCSSQLVFEKPSAQAALLQDYAYESRMLSKLSDQLDNDSDHKTLCAKLAHEAKVREGISSGNVLTGLMAADTQLVDMAQHTDGMSPNCDPCLLLALLRDYSALDATTLRDYTQTTKAMALQSFGTIAALKVLAAPLFANKPEHEEWLQRTSDDCVDTALMQMRIVLNEIRFERRLSNAATAKDLMSKQKDEGGEEAMEQQLEVVAETDTFNSSPGIIVNIPHLENSCLTPINGLDDDIADLHLEHIPDLDLQPVGDTMTSLQLQQLFSDTDEDNTKVLINAHEDYQCMWHLFSLDQQRAMGTKYGRFPDVCDAAWIEAKIKDGFEPTQKVTATRTSEHMLHFEPNGDRTWDDIKRWSLKTGQSLAPRRSPAGSDDAISLPQTGGGNVSYEIDPKNAVNGEGVNAMNDKDTSTDYV